METQTETKKESKKLFNKLTDWYFEPKGFEKSGKLYENLGVKTFKKYCPNGGTKFSLTGKWGKEIMQDGLKYYINKTKVFETAHLVLGESLYAGSMILSLNQKNYGILAGLTIANLLINIYPIITQRYNRNKAQKILDKYGDKVK